MNWRGQLASKNLSVSSWPTSIISNASMTRWATLRAMPFFGGIDFSPLVILILIQVIKRLLAGVVIQYYGA